MHDLELVLPYRVEKVESRARWLLTYEFRQKRFLSKLLRIPMIICALRACEACLLGAASMAHTCHRRVHDFGWHALKVLRKGVVFTLFNFTFSFCWCLGSDVFIHPQFHSAASANACVTCSHDFQACSSSRIRAQHSGGKRGRLTPATLSIFLFQHKFSHQMTQARLLMEKPGCRG
ncbi:hypothetical protein Plim_2736 [Planctopirus limnophila DSM 3776]|uniref:Uncharacterized protein n=1 Tax=Planctopirus limnophila (strain ATCC 43296 / DSM 3776 / IFAM 1008 / Mu 290) TaxID=521674 RepID=D5SQU7_PLAL2|nr:hypothetical protein Plim_2736 [Planctopirus limnophila DSM 3776]